MDDKEENAVQKETTVAHFLDHLYPLLGIGPSYKDVSQVVYNEFKIRFRSLHAKYEHYALEIVQKLDILYNFVKYPPSLYLYLV